jgi:hypothetical protein
MCGRTSGFSTSLPIIGDSGAGEGIRTLDPNLGKVPEASAPHYPATAAET